MSSESIFYRLRIRSRADDADLLVITSVTGTTNPYLTEAPSGDGQSVDPITGAATTGDYTFRMADPETDIGTRVVTAQLADVNARQQLLSLRAYGEKSGDGSTWTALVSGYVLGCRLISAIEYEISIGATRRREVSRELFKAATTNFANTTAVIGGPVLEDFAGLLKDNGGWTYKVESAYTTPDYFRLQLQANGGFDPRKSPTVTFSSMSTAIRDFTVNWARPYFQPSNTWLTADESDPIYGNFPGLRAKLVPITVPADPIRYFVPLAAPAGLGPGINSDYITAGGATAWLRIPKVDVQGTAFTPAINDQFEVYIYAVPISDQNPLHVYEHPVDLWEKLMIDAGYVAGTDYDDTNLAALKTSINTWLGGDVRLMLRITDSIKHVDFVRSVIYGPFRLSTRVINGKRQLFSIRVRGTVRPTDVITIADLRSDQGTVFEIEEETVVTAVTLKQLKVFPWSTEESKQPDIDALVATKWPVDTIENSDDDIPPGLADSGHEAELGNIPGTIMLHNATASLIAALPFEQYLVTLAAEIFDLFGRGSAQGDMNCIADVANEVGDQVLVDLVHRPNAVVGQTPVSQRGGERRVLIIQRTEEPEGPVLRVMDAVTEDSEPPGAGGGSEEETNPAAIGTPAGPVAFPSGAGSARADWVDAYPQFYTQVQWEGHPPGDPTFTLLYGGDHLVSPGLFSDSQAGIGIGWIVRCRYRLTDLAANSSWSSYSNEITVSGSGGGEGPTDYPDNLVATSPVADQAHAEWTNSNAILQIRIQWQTSDTVPPGPPTDESFVNVAGGKYLLAVATTANDIPTGPGTYARFKLAYVNTSGVTGTWSPWSNYVEITT